MIKAIEMVKTHPYAAGPSREGPGPRAGTVMGPHCRRLQKPFLSYALSNAVRWTVKGMNFEINAPEKLEFVF